MKDVGYWMGKITSEKRPFCIGGIDITVETPALPSQSMMTFGKLYGYLANNAGSLSLLMCYGQFTPEVGALQNLSASVRVGCFDNVDFVISTLRV